MRLVISYVEGDGCTYSCQRDIPVEYDSAEKLLCDIEHAANDFINKAAERDREFDAFYGKHGSFPEDPKKRDAWWEINQAMREKWKRYDDEESPRLHLLKKGIYVSHFIEDGKFYSPEILTLDEWFEATVTECNDDDPFSS